MGGVYYPLKPWVNRPHPVQEAGAPYRPACSGEGYQTMAAGRGRGGRLGDLFWVEWLGGKGLLIFFTGVC